APIATLRHYAGTVEMVRALSAAIPDEALVVCDVTTLFYSALPVAEGKRVVRGDLRDPDMKRLLDEIAEAAAQKGQPVYLLTDAPVVSEASRFQSSEWTLEYPFLAAATRPPAREVRLRRVRLFLARIDGAARAFS